MAASKSGKKSFRHRLLRITVIFLLLLTAAFLAMENSLSQVILDMAYADAYAMAVNVINSAVADVMHAGITYEDLIKVYMNSQGQATMLQANTVQMNELATKAALEAQEKLQDARNKTVYIPLGKVLGINFLAGSGPRIPVQILPVGAVSTQFVTEFESAGINQTRHKIFLAVKTMVSLVIPTGARQVNVTSQVPITESIIVGDVPNTFAVVETPGQALKLLP
jgi:sporulation protein YunB